MVSRITNALAVQPFTGVKNLKVLPILGGALRNADVFTKDLDGDGETDVTLNFTPLVPAWLEVWIDGFRVINITKDFGKTYDKYELIGRTIRFYTPQTGSLTVICDKTNEPLLANNGLDNRVIIDNSQGAEGKAANKEFRAAQYCEPLAVTLPQHGSVRLTDDRKNLLYIPQRLYEGYDAFSYCVITDRGQISTPACVFVQVGNPKPVKK